MYAVVDALIKKQNIFGGQILFMDTFDEYKKEFSISTNRWSGTAFMAEMRTMLEVFREIKNITVENGKLVIITDNLRLK